MAINPELTETITIPNLDTASILIENYFAHCTPTGSLKKATMDMMATFIAPYVNVAGANLFIKGTATPTTNPGTPDNPELWITVEPGTYTNFGGLVVPINTFALLFWDGLTWTLSSTALDLTNYVLINDLKEYFNLDFSNLGGVTYFPEDRTTDTVTLTVLNPGVTYYEESVFFGLNTKLLNVYIKAPIAGVVKLQFIEIVSGTASIIWNVEKTLVIGVNTFTLESLNLPDFVFEKEKVYIGINQNPTANGAVTVYTKSGFDVKTVTNPSGVPSTISNLVTNMWVQVDNSQYLIGNYKKIDYLSRYEPNDIYKTINDKSGVNDFIGGVSDTSYFGEGEQFLTDKQKLVRLNFKSISTGNFQIIFVSYAFGVGTVVHTSTVNVSVPNQIYSWAPSELSLPDLSSYEKVYIFLHNTISDITLAPVKLSTTAVDQEFTVFNPGTGTISFSTGAYRLPYWIDVVNDDPNIADELDYLREKVDSSTVSTYSELMSALENQDIVYLRDGTIIIPETIVIPSGKRIQGGRKAILQADTGVTPLISIDNVDDVILDGFTLIGTGATIDINSTALVEEASDIEQYPTNIGTGIGVYCYKASGSILNLRIKNFNRSAIEVEQTFNQPGGSFFPKGIDIDNVICEDSYFGIRFNLTGEYSRVSNANCLRNVCGISIVSGNIAVSNSHFTQNRIGAHIGGKYEEVPAADTNNAHGGFSNCFFNHCSLRGLFVINITNGQVFSNCNFFDGLIEFVNCIGVSVTGSLIASAINVTSNISQLSMITNCIFRSDGGSGAGTIVKVGAGRLSMFGNRYTSGNTDTALNQEL